MILRSPFSRFGIPKSLVSDNGPGFNSTEFGKFVSNNIIWYCLYWNGTLPFMFERFSRESGADNQIIEENDWRDIRRASVSINLQFSNYAICSNKSVFNHGNGIFGRTLRTWLDLIRDPASQISEKVEFSTDKFPEGTPVWVRSCVNGSVLRPVCKVMCEITTPLGNWTGHFDHLRYLHEGMTIEVAPALDASPHAAPQAELMNLLLNWCV